MMHHVISFRLLSLFATLLIRLLVPQEPFLHHVRLELARRVELLLPRRLHCVLTALRLWIQATSWHLLRNHLRHTSVETVLTSWRNVRHCLLRLVVVIVHAARRVRAPQVYHSYHGVAADRTSTVRHVVAGHEGRLGASGSRLVAAVMTSVHREVVVLRCQRQWRVCALFKWTCGLPTHECVLRPELQWRGRGREVKLTGVVVLVLALNHAAKAAHPTGVPEYVHFLDTPRRGRGWPHFLELLASVHYKLRLVQLLHAHVVVCAEGRLRSARAGDARRRGIPGPRAHLMNSIAA